MSDEKTPAPATPEPVAPATPEPTPNPTPAAAAPAANPEDGGTGQTPEPAIRNNPAEPVTPEGYTPNDKFAASQAEALRLRQVAIDNGIDPKTGLPTGNPPAAPTAVPPTVPTTPAPLTAEQAAAQIPGFSTLTPQEKALVLNPREAYKDITDMKRELAVIMDGKETDKQIKELVANDEYKDLDQEGFREFIYKEENLGVKNLETLAKMYKTENATPPAPPTPEGGEPTTAGAKEIAPNADGVTEVTGAEAAQMRKESPKRYGELLRSKKLRIVNE